MAVSRVAIHTVSWRYRRTEYGRGVPAKHSLSVVALAGLAACEVYKSLTMWDSELNAINFIGA